VYNDIASNQKPARDPCRHSDRDEVIWRMDNININVVVPEADSKKTSHSCRSDAIQR
jgi:hypothetical protein